jgi:hypothetical protein
VTHGCRCLLVVEYASATHPYTYLFPSVELRERFCTIVRNARDDHPPPPPRILLGSWNLGEWRGEAGLLDWILSGDSTSSSSDVSGSRDHDVYVLCLQGRFQEKAAGDELTDVGSPDGQIGEQLLALLGPQFVICAKVVGVAGAIIVACSALLMRHVTNMEVFEGSGGAQDAPGGVSALVSSGEACAVSMCIAEASFLFLNWPAITRPSPGVGGLSLSQIDAMVTAAFPRFL